MRRQQAQRPQLVWIAALLGFDAGLADQPGASRFRELGPSSRTRQVVNCLERSYSLDPTRTARDPLTVDAQRCGNLGHSAPVRQMQDDS
jgi:hypothetical protein